MTDDADGIHRAGGDLQTPVELVRHGLAITEQELGPDDVNTAVMRDVVADTEAAARGEPPAEIRLPRERLHLLGRRVNPKGPADKPAHRGLLAAELARQAVLIEARDELGLPTRDAALGDAISSKDPDALAVGTLVDPGGTYAFLIAPDPKSPRQFEPMQRGFRFQEAGGLVNYAELSAKLGHPSREDFPALLEQAGFARLPQAPQADAGEVDAATDELLNRFSPVAQLTAVHLYRAMEHPADFPAARIDRIIAAQGMHQHVLFEYAFGWWLVQTGDRETGRRLLSRVVARPTTLPIVSTLARLRLDALDQPPPGRTSGVRDRLPGAAESRGYARGRRSPARLQRVSPRRACGARGAPAPA